MVYIIYCGTNMIINNILLTVTRAKKNIPYTKFSVVNAHPNFVFYHLCIKKMDKTTINQALQMPFEDQEVYKYYFILAQAKFRDAIQFCKRIGIKYFNKYVFWLFNISHYQGYEFLRNSLSLCQLHNNLI